MFCIFPGNLKMKRAEQAWARQTGEVLSEQGVMNEQESMNAQRHGVWGTTSGLVVLGSPHGL